MQQPEHDSTSSTPPSPAATPDAATPDAASSNTPTSNVATPTVATPAATTSPTSTTSGSATPATATAAASVARSRRRRPNEAERAERRQHIFALSVVMILVAFVAALFHERAFRGLGDFRAMDAAQVARHIAAGHGFSTDFLRPDAAGVVSNRALVPDVANAPLWPLLLGIAFSFMEANDRTANLLSLVLFVLASGLLFTLARRLTGSLLTACLAVAAFALSRPVLGVADSASPLMLATPLLLATLLLLTPDATSSNATSSNATSSNATSSNATSNNAISSGATSNAMPEVQAANSANANGEARKVALFEGVDMRRHFWAGVMAALCCLCDYPLVFLVVPLVLIWNRVWRNWNKRTIAAWILGFALVALPWTIRNVRVAGTPFPVSAWLESTGLMGTLAPLVPRTIAGLASLFSTLPFLPNIVLAPFLVLAVFISSGARGMQAVKWGLIAAVPIYFVASSVLGRASATVLLPLSGLLCVVGVHAFLALLDGALENWRNAGAAGGASSGREAMEAQEEKRRRRQLSPRLRTGALAALSLLFIAPLLVSLFNTPRAVSSGVAKVLEPLGRSVPANRIIATDMPAAVAWYANHKAAPISFALAQRVATRRAGEQTALDDIGAIYLSPLLASYPAVSEVAPWQKLWQAALSRRGGLPNFSVEARPETRDVFYVRLPGLAEAQRLAQSQPKNATAQYEVAQALYSQNREAEALRKYIDAIRLRPEWAEPRVGAARAAMQLKKPDLAAANYSAALKIDPRSLPARLGLAEVRLAQNQNEAARALYESVLADSPNQPVAMNNLAFIYASSGRDLARATEMARRALAADPTNVAMLDTLGWVFTRSGRAKDGIPYLREAVKRAPTSAVLQSHLGQALIANNQTAEGAAYLRRALEGQMPAKEKAQAQAALSKAGG